MRSKTDGKGPEREAKQHPEESQCFKQSRHDFPVRFQANSLEAKVNRAAESQRKLSGLFAFSAKPRLLAVYREFVARFHVAAL
jgi:hypothetical protein